MQDGEFLVVDRKDSEWQIILNDDTGMYGIFNTISGEWFVNMEFDKFEKIGNHYWYNADLTQPNGDLYKYAFEFYEGILRIAQIDVRIPIYQAFGGEVLNTAVLLHIHPENAHRASEYVELAKAAVNLVVALADDFDTHSPRLGYYSENAEALFRRDSFVELVWMMLSTSEQQSPDSPDFEEPPFGFYMHTAFSDTEGMWGVFVRMNKGLWEVAAVYGTDGNVYLDDNPPEPTMVASTDVESPQTTPVTPDTPPIAPNTGEQGNTTGNLVNQGKAVLYGDRIYFSHYNGTTTGIYSVDLNGNDRQTVLERNESTSVHYNLNAVGGRLYFVRHGHDTGLFSMNLDGSDVTRLCNDNDQVFGVHVVGDDIYFISQVGYENFIYTMKTDGSGRTRICPSGHRREYIFAAGDWLYWGNFRMRLDGSDKEVFIQSGGWVRYVGVAGGRAYVAVWYGERYCAATLYRGNSEISFFTEEAINHEIATNGDGINVTENSIFFTNQSDQAFYRMNLDGSNVQKVFDGFVYRPNIVGNLIFFYHSAGANQHSFLHVMNLDGSNLRRV
jgi:hypothetical protein